MKCYLTYLCAAVYSVHFNAQYKLNRFFNSVYCFIIRYGHCSLFWVYFKFFSSIVFWCSITNLTLITQKKIKKLSSDFLLVLNHFIKLNHSGPVRWFLRERNNCGTAKIRINFRSSDHSSTNRYL